MIHELKKICVGMSLVGSLKCGRQINEILTIIDNQLSTESHKNFEESEIKRFLFELIEDGLIDVKGGKFILTENGILFLKNNSTAIYIYDGLQILRKK